MYVDGNISRKRSSPNNNGKSGCPSEFKDIQTTFRYFQYVEKHTKILEDRQDIGEKYLKNTGEGEFFSYLCNREGK